MQLAYARVVTDHANFAWLCDVYDAHTVYATHGFVRLPEPDRWMVRQTT